MEQTPGDIVTLVDGAEFWAFAKRPPLTGD
jgi:hypothetical protein